MTIAQARAYFGLKDGDKVLKSGLESIKAAAQERLAVWSLPTSDKQELRKEIEAVDTLMEIAEEA